MKMSSQSSFNLEKCPYSTLKHLTAAILHAPSDIQSDLVRVRGKLLKNLDLDEEYVKVREQEHIIEEEIERKIREKFALEDERARIESGGCSANPAPNPLFGECKFKREEIKPLKYFHPESFRILCPECPKARCVLCPPELKCATRILIGCKNGEWDEKAERCRIGTETHSIYRA